MKKEYSLRHLVLSGVSIAIGIIIPLLVHAIAADTAGRMLLPMHLGVMVAAFFLPPLYAAAVGALTPILSWLITGMPVMAPLPIAAVMAFELAAYALVISLFRKIVYRRRKNYFAPYIALVPAMIFGRIVAGLALYALMMVFSIKGPSPVTYVTGAVTAGLVGIAIQLVLVPLLYRALVNALPGWKSA